MNGGVKLLKLKLKPASLSEPAKQAYLSGDVASGRKRSLDEFPGSDLEESAEHTNSFGAPPGYPAKRPATLLNSVLSIPSASGPPSNPRPTISLKFPSPAARGRSGSGQKPPRGRGHGARQAAAEPTSSAELTSPRGRGRRGRGGGRGRRGGGAGRGAGRGRGRQRRSRKGSDDEEDEPDEAEDSPDAPTPISVAPPEPKPVLKMKISHAVTALQNPAPAVPTAAPPPPQPKSVDRQDLLRVIDHIQKKDRGAIFKSPVTDDVAPGYSDLIKQPMDFSTMRSKVTAGTYTSWDLLQSDLELMFNNAMIYNPQDTIFYREARTLLAVSHKVLELAREGVRNFRGRTNGVIRAQNAQIAAEERAVKEAQKGLKGQKSASNANQLAAAADAQDDAVQEEGGAADHPRARNTARPMVKDTDGRRPLMLDENLRATYRPRYTSMGQSAAAWGGLAGGASAEGCMYAAGRPVLKQVPNAPPDALLHSVARFITNCSDTVKEHVLGSLLQCVAVDHPRPKLSLPSQIRPTASHHQQPGGSIPPMQPPTVLAQQFPPHPPQATFPSHPVSSLQATVPSQLHQAHIHQQAPSSSAPSSHRSISSAAGPQPPSDLQLQQQPQSSQSAAYINALRQSALAQQAAAAVAALQQPNLTSSQSNKYQTLQGAPVARQLPTGSASLQASAHLQQHQPSIPNQPPDNRLQQLSSQQQQPQLQGNRGAEQVRIPSQQGLHLPTAQQQPPPGVPGRQLPANDQEVLQQYLKMQGLLRTEYK